MTWLDWIVIALSIGFIVQGLFKGVTTVALSTLAIAVAYVVAALLLPTLGESLAHMTPMPPGWGRMAGFLIVFFATYVVLSLVISVLPGGKRPASSAQILGMFAGALKALVAAMAGAGILLASPMADTFAKDIERSPIVRYAADLQRNAMRSLVNVSPIKFPPVGPDAKF